MRRRRWVGCRRCDSLEGLLSDGERGDVDAVGGKKLRVGREVDGGNGVASAEAATGGGGAVDGEGAAEQGARLADVARGDEGANAAGGDRAAAQAERVVDGDGEAEFAAQGLQAGWAGDAGLGLAAKRKFAPSWISVTWRARARTRVAKSQAELRRSSSVKGRTRVASIPVSASSSACAPA